MKYFFKPEDFPMSEQFPGVAELSAKAANEKLAKLIESWPVVYGEFQDNMIVKPFGMVKGVTDNHTARLAFLEEIKKEPCKHFPIQHNLHSKTTEFPMGFHCKHCGAELVAEWKEKK